VTHCGKPGNGTGETVATTIESIDGIQHVLQEHRYVADRSLATTIFLALRLRKPILLEGEAGVGKTEIAKVLADLLGTNLIRLQCYEGIDVSNALYEWNYARQMLEIRLVEATGGDREETLKDLFGPEFLIRRPLLQAIDHGFDSAPVLLIDEIDRADDEFEAFLLELLSDFQVTVPEIGTITTDSPPVVVITSNRTREIHDALKRRCLYQWIDYPSFAKEFQIVTTKVPEAHSTLARQICGFIQELRTIELYKLPGVAETLDWARALVQLGSETLDDATVEATLGCFLKYQEDIDTIRGPRAHSLLATANAGVVGGDGADGR
jgi:MoxR-like ATPase